MFNTAELKRELTREEKEEIFFSNPRVWSFSALSQILTSPRLFYKERVLKEVDKDESRHFGEGTLIHCMLLESDTLTDKYIVQSGKIPIEKPGQIMDKVYQTWLAEKILLGPQGGNYINVSLRDYSALIIEEMKSLDYYQNLKTDEQRLEKVITPVNTEYFEFLKSSPGKTIVSQETWDYCVKAVEYVKNHPKCAFLLGLNPEELNNSEVINEHLIRIEPTEDKPGLKGFIDSHHINHDHRIIFVSDFKTSGKPLDRFKKSVQDYNYHLQGALYRRLIAHKYADLIDAGYEIVVHFVTIDNNLNVYPFPVSEESMARWTADLDQAIKKAEWHCLNRSFNSQYHYELNLVEL
jgi:hypothetical protein